MFANSIFLDKLQSFLDLKVCRVLTDCSHCVLPTFMNGNVGIVSNKLPYLWVRMIGADMADRILTLVL